MLGKKLQVLKYDDFLEKDIYAKIEEKAEIDFGDHYDEFALDFTVQKIVDSLKFLENRKKRFQQSYFTTFFDLKETQTLIENLNLFPPLQAYPTFRENQTLESCLEIQKKSIRTFRKINTKNENLTLNEFEKLENKTLGLNLFNKKLIILYINHNDYHNDFLQENIGDFDFKDELYFNKEGIFKAINNYLKIINKKEISKNSFNYQLNQTILKITDQLIQNHYQSFFKHFNQIKNKK